MAHTSHKFKTQKSSGGKPCYDGRSRFAKERRRLGKIERLSVKRALKKDDCDFWDGVTSIFSIGWDFY